MAANRERGEVSIEINGVAYTLVLNTNACVTLEDLFSTPTREMLFHEVLGKVAAGSMRYIRGFLWAALHTHHPALSVADVGDLLDAAGGIEAFAQQLATLTGSAVPEKEDLRTLTAGRKGNPPKAQGGPARGTGRRSGASPAASA